MKVTVTIEVPDPHTGKTAFPFGAMQVRTPLFRAIGLQTQWPVALLEVGDAPVRVYHSENSLGFELQDGTRWVLLLSDMALGRRGHGPDLYRELPAG